MPLSFLLLLLVVFSEMCAGMGFTSGGTEVSESSVVITRLDKMERLLHEQDAKLVRQENLLRLQETILRQQDAKLSHQASLLHQQDAMLSHLNTALRQQDAKLSHQEGVLRQQNAMLSDQKSVLRQQDAKLSRQESVLRQQDAKLSHQETLLFQYGKLIQQLRADKVDRRSELGNRPTSDKLQQPLPDTLTTGRYNVTGHMELPPAALGSDDILTATAHDVMSRSDDGGPLEAVVSHISQQVTELSVDIQTLKNSNSQQNHDIQDAQSSTFVHWGSSQCGGSSHLVYSGVVGGLVMV